jgi:hypothetical protein
MSQDPRKTQPDTDIGAGISRGLLALLAGPADEAGQQACLGACAARRQQARHRAMFRAGQRVRVTLVRGDDHPPAGGCPATIDAVTATHLHATVDFADRGLIMLTFRLTDLHSDTPAAPGTSPAPPPGQWAIHPPAGTGFLTQDDAEPVIIRTYWADLT